jgi:hypothetical protein
MQSSSLAWSQFSTTAVLTPVAAMLDPMPLERHVRTAVNHTTILKRGPHKKFTYIPVIPHLVGFFKNADLVEKMQYCGSGADNPNSHHYVPGTIKDIFDGTHYCTLQTTHVTVDDKKRPYKFFSNPQDVALGLSTDGFAPFRHQQTTAWPLLLFNFNLPPEI